MVFITICLVFEKNKNKIIFSEMFLKIIIKRFSERLLVSQKNYGNIRIDIIILILNIEKKN